MLFKKKCLAKKTCAEATYDVMCSTDAMVEDYLELMKKEVDFEDEDYKPMLQLLDKTLVMYQQAMELAMLQASKMDIIDDINKKLDKILEIEN